MIPDEPAWFRNYDKGVPRSLKPYPDLTLLDYLRQNAASWPGRPALFFKGATISYDNLEKWSDRFAGGLIEAGVN
jgi:long-chain acyl-CoA synthetase